MAKLGDTLVIYCKHCGQRHEFLVTSRAAASKKYCSENCRKRRYDNNNRWKQQDACPSCGGIKEKRSRLCHNCIKGTRFY